jgi:hypothetical protein
VDLRLLSACVLLAAITLTPGPATADIDGEAYIGQTRVELEAIATQPARRKGHAPENRREAIKRMNNGRYSEPVALLV